MESIDATNAWPVELETGGGKRPVLETQTICDPGNGVWPGFDQLAVY